MKNLKKRAASILIAAITVLSVTAAAAGGGNQGLIPDIGISVSAAEGIKYINASGASKTCSSYTTVDDDTTRFNGGWYVVKGKVAIDGRLNVTDDSFLILTDGSKLTVTGGISVASGVKFNVYTQRDSSASLYAGTTNGSKTTASLNSCGIGGKGAYVNLVGGNIYARGGENTYGIQGEEIHLYWTSINDSVYANSYKGTVKILSPYVDKSSGSAYNECSVTASALKGVTLKAANAVDSTTTEFSDGIYAAFGKVTVDDRITVSDDAELYLANNCKMVAEEGITVSRGNTLNIYGNGGKLYAGTTNGNTQTANDGDAGIGAFNSGKAGSIIINSGVVYAYGGRNAAGIGGNGAYVEIDGGEVKSNGGRYGAGIGSSYGDGGADVRIVGGNVYAYGGSNAAGIGSGYGSSRSSITLSWSDSRDSIYATSYSGNIQYLKTLYVYETGEKAGTSNINDRTLLSSVSGYTVKFETNGAGYVADKTVVAGGKLTMLPYLTRNGYVFDGWYTDRNFNNKFNENSAITSNITLYAKWASNVHTITFNSMGGSKVGYYSINHGDVLTVRSLPEPSRSGYRFDGWYTDKNCRYAYKNTQITEDITLYAGWTYSKTYETVKFNSMGGSAVSSKSVEKGSYIGNLPTPVRSGYIFTGWYIDKNCTVLFNPSSSIDANITLYAGWVKETSTVCWINFVPNGGTDVDSMKIVKGDTVSQTDMPFPQRQGYVFDGWYTDRACTNKKASYKITSDMTLYAGWVKEYSDFCWISFIPNGGTDVEAMRISRGDTISQTDLPFPQRQDYTFNGWYLDRACTSKKASYTINADTVLYAGWIKNTVAAYTVRFFLDGTLVDTQNIDEGYYAVDPYRGQYQWKTGSGKSFDFNTRIYQDYDLEAFTPVVNKYDVNFYLDGDLVDSQQVEEGGYASSNRFNSGYTWKTGSGSIFNFNTRIYQDYDLYSERTRTYTVRFYLDGSLVDTQTVEEGSYASDPYSGAYEWKNGSSRFSFSTPIKSDYDLYASTPAPTTHTVSFDPNGGILTGSSAYVVNEGEKVSRPSDPARRGYNFLYWSENNSSEYNFNNGVYSDLILYAVWEEDRPAPAATHTVNVYIDNAYVDTQYVTEGGTASNLYGYSYWTTGSGAPFSFSDPIYYDVDIYASSYTGSTFSGAGLIAAIAGGAVLVGGGIAAAVVIGKKKKK